jgi:HTH-type transcriptional regulator/antitoxin HigA
MESPEYTIIKSTEQYKDYCNLLESLVMIKRKTRAHRDTIELLTLLIEKWDEAHSSFSGADPVELLAYLMKENRLKATALAAELGFSKSLLSDILHYRRGFSREIIRKLSSRFKVSQELFNRPYKLALPGNGRLEKPGIKRPGKKRAAC